MADLVDVVRCRHCRYYNADSYCVGNGWCQFHDQSRVDNGFCDNGDRRTAVIMDFDIGKNIKQLRIRRGISQRTLSKATGIDLSSLRCYESGEREPRASRIVWLASYLGVTTDELILGEEFGREL